MDGRRRAGLAAAARRGDMGMTQQQLADAAEADVKTIRDMERGRRWPIATNRAKIEAALGWPSGELERLRLLGDTDFKPVPPEFRRFVEQALPGDIEAQRRVIGMLEGTLTWPDETESHSADPPELRPQAN